MSIADWLTPDPGSPVQSLVSRARPMYNRPVALLTADCVAQSDATKTAAMAHPERCPSTERTDAQHSGHTPPDARGVRPLH
jgi:hypothetical protein